MYFCTLLNKELAFFSPDLAVFLLNALILNKYGLIAAGGLLLI